MWVIYLILSIQSIAVLVALVLIIRRVYSNPVVPNIIVKNEQNDIEDSIRGGVKSAIKELEYEKEEEELLMHSIDGNRQGMGVFSSTTDDEPVNTHGDLIPANLSDSDKEILRMFYNER
jgi:hypothetical protein